jgi:hypothetical protein
MARILHIEKRTTDRSLVRHHLDRRHLAYGHRVYSVERVTHADHYLFRGRRYDLIIVQGDNTNWAGRRHSEGRRIVILSDVAVSGTVRRLSKRQMFEDPERFRLEIENILSQN